MKPLVTFRDAIENGALLGAAFPRKPSEPDSWIAWRALGCAITGEPLTAEERDAFHRVTALDREPGERIEEASIVKSRRSGGTTFAAALAVYSACLIDYADTLGVGERGVMLFLAPSQKQADIAFSRAAGLIDNSPALASMVVSRTADTIRLNNGVDLEIRPASFRSVRGLTLVGAIVDEAAYLRQEGAASSDVELLAALRPALVTVRGTLLVTSTPFARAGELYDAYTRYHGRPGPVLSAHGTWREWNPTLPESVVERALSRDPIKARCEFFGEFRTDVTGFISRELIESAVDRGISERPPAPDVTYHCFVDAASGLDHSQDGDRFALAIGHVEGETVVIDFVQRWLPPFSASSVTAEAAAIARRYGCDTATSDGFSSGFLRSELARHGVGHRISEQSKSELYLATLPMLTSGRVRLLDLDYLINEFSSLERKTGSAGHDKIDARGHEDAANVVAAVVAMLATAPPDPGILTFYKNWSERVMGVEQQPAAPQFSYQFASDPLVLVKVPAGAEATLFGICSIMNAADSAIASMTRAQARTWLQRPDWRQLNAAIARELGLAEEAA
jgi:hypothetical protein